MPKWQRFGIPAGMYTNEELRKAGIDVDESKNIPTLRRGSRGDMVEELQALLNAKCGAGLEVDGIYGAATEAAVRAFQNGHGLTADGICGPKTWKALGVKDINVPDNNAGNITQPANNGNNELPQPDAQPQTITIPLTDWQAIKAAVMAAYHIIKQYEG